MNQPLALFGILKNRPLWFIRHRGRFWLRSGFCPCCFSSPPLPECDICSGTYLYGNDLDPKRKMKWAKYWEIRCDIARVKRGRKA